MRFGWQLKLGVILLSFTLVIYSIKYLVLKNPADTLNYVFNSLGFLFISAFLVTIILNEMLTMRSRKERLEKLNMIIGVFYSDIGTKLLKKFSAVDPDISELRSALVVSNNWSTSDFTEAFVRLQQHKYHLDSREISLVELHEFLQQHQGLMLTLLENPQIFEHDRFTDLLHAVFHLSEELNARESLVDLPITDYSHLSVDLTRVYNQLVFEWLEYMQHLKKKYPYLFSLSMRMNPFDTNASVIVKE